MKCDDFSINCDSSLNPCAHGDTLMNAQKKAVIKNKNIPYSHVSLKFNDFIDRKRL